MATGPSGDNGMGRSQRAKGCRGEREAAAALKEHLGLNDARRGVQYAGGPYSPDVAHDLDDVIHFEVKRVEALKLWPSLQQAENDAGGKASMVLHRANGKPWIAICRLDELMEIAHHLADHANDQRSDTK